jgi:hypothetical protein
LFSKYDGFVSGVEYGVEELKIMRVFGQIYPHFEDLEKLLPHPDEKFKADTLTRILTSCLDSYRPVKSLEDAVKRYRAEKSLKKRHIIIQNPRIRHMIWQQNL